MLGGQERFSNWSACLRVKIAESIALTLDRINDVEIGSMTYHVEVENPFILSIGESLCTRTNSIVKQLVGQR